MSDDSLFKTLHGVLVFESSPFLCMACNEDYSLLRVITAVLLCARHLDELKEKVGESE